jgi:hypothetical protein
MHYGKNIIIIINTVLFILFHGMKFGRYADRGSKQIIRGIGYVAIALAVFIVLNIWPEEPPPFDFLLLGILFVVLIAQHRWTLKYLFSAVFAKRGSILESLLLTCLLAVTYLFVSISLLSFFVPFTVMMVFVLKEALLISPGFQGPSGKKTDPAD